MIAYWPVLLMVAVAVGFAVASMVVSYYIAVKGAPNPDKLRPYECGVESEGTNQIHVPVKFYLVMLLFLLFDVETIFLIGWALVFPQHGLYAFGVMTVFMFFLVVGLIYEWKKGALTWQ